MAEDKVRTLISYELGKLMDEKNKADILELERFEKMYDDLFKNVDSFFRGSNVVQMNVDYGKSIASFWEINEAIAPVIEELRKRGYEAGLEIDVPREALASTVYNSDQVNYTLVIRRKGLWRKILED